MCDDDLADQLISEGYGGYPVVKVVFDDGRTHSWSGYRRDEITKLAEALRT